jgi:glyceraldehyde 3-phosphate dehydrogenase
MRVAQAMPELDVVHVNEIAGDAAAAAHLLTFDSTQGTWEIEVGVANDGLVVGGVGVSYSSHSALQQTPWQDLGVDVVVDCTGAFKTVEALQPYFQQGVKKVVVSAPVKEQALNVVMGVNDALYDSSRHHVVSAASCTTNCIAPVIKVLHERFVIEHGLITTIHDVTNTQSVLDNFHKDLRRARASGVSLIPTSTGSATAITEIFPDLKGKLDGIAVRVPIANASLADCVFELASSVRPEEVNAALQAAAEGELRGILGVEHRPLVSVDYLGDPRSGVVDALSTRVVNNRQVKVLVWYDNEMGYVHRMMELVRKICLTV